MEDKAYLVTSCPRLIRFPARKFEGETYPGFLLVPNKVNEVPRASVELAKKLLPGSRMFSEHGVIKEVPGPEKAAAPPAPKPKASPPPEPEPEPEPEAPEPAAEEEASSPQHPASLEGLSASAAREAARACEDKELLASWLKEETRTTVRKEIHEKLEG